MPISCSNEKSPDKFQRLAIALSMIQPWNITGSRLRYTPQNASRPQFGRTCGSLLHDLRNPVFKGFALKFQPKVMRQSLISCLLKVILIMMLFLKHLHALICDSRLWGLWDYSLFCTSRLSVTLSVFTHNCIPLQKVQCLSRRARRRHFPSFTGKMCCKGRENST